MYTIIQSLFTVKTIMISEKVIVIKNCCQNHLIIYNTSQIQFYSVTTTVSIYHTGHIGTASPQYECAGER